MELEQSWLIQRLQKPFEPGEFSTPANFKEMAGNVGNVVQFDYMGSAEFEDGSVHRAFKAIWDDREAYETFRMKLGEQTVWGLCHKDLTDAVKVRIEMLHAGDRDFNYRSLKEKTGIVDAIAGRDKIIKIVAWLELDNSFFFTIDKPTHKQFIKLFGKTVPGEA